MRLKAKGRYTRMSKSNPLGIGRCDYSGLMVAHRDLCKQMAYSGKGLYWTGLWVYKKFLDDPNPQNMAPKLRADPVPLKHARPDKMVAPEHPNPLVVNTDALTSYTVNFGTASFNPFMLQGTPLANPFLFFFPVVVGNWTLVNGTPSPLQVSLILPSGPNNPTFSVPSNETQTFYGDGQTLSTEPFVM